MEKQIELTDLDLRYEDYRLKSPGSEKILLNSILENGIRDPLHGIDTQGRKILIDGFKRYRCAKKLNIGIIPYISLGSDEALAIIKLIRFSTARSLSIVEQARWIDELKAVYQMSTVDIARLLEKSKSWVSMRSGIITEMSDCVKNKIFKGDFPVYSFMYTLRKFIRMNEISKTDIDIFVKAVAGKGLSIRDIEQLANGFFKGTEDFRQQIIKGNIIWGLSRLKESAAQTTECTTAEQKLLKDLELVQRYMRKITCMAGGDKLCNDAFYAQAGLLALEIIKTMNDFNLAVRSLYDRCQ